MRRFHLVCKSDEHILVGGVVWEDGYVVVRWNATQNMPISNHGLGLFESVEWFLAIHGRDAEIRYIDKEHG